MLFIVSEVSFFDFLEADSGVISKVGHNR